MSHNENSRRHERRNISWAVRVKATSWHKARQVLTGNIGRGGLFIRTNQGIEPGTTLAITIWLPDDTSLKLEGVVVHSIPTKRAAAEHLDAGFGVKFDEQHAADLDLLEAMVNSCAEEMGSRSDGQPVGLPAVLFGHGQGIAEATTAHPFEGEESSPGPSRPESREEDSSIFGIDFGTSFARIALVKGKQVRVFSDRGGQSMIPSVVSYPEHGGMLVGWQARQNIATYPETTLSSPRRLLGQRYHDRSIQPLLGSSPVKLIKREDGMVAAQIYGENISIPQVCSEILRSLARIGEQGAGQRVKRVVLSTRVADQEARKSMEAAARLADLEVVAILDEPVAAAMACGVRLNGEQQMVAVYDLGGGTFEFTLLQIRGKGNVAVVGSADEPWLGGQDFDREIAEFAASIFHKKHQIDLRQRQVEWHRLLLLCEAAKRQLSNEPEAQILAKAIVLSDEGPIDLQVVIDRELMEVICEGLVRRSTDTMDACMKRVGVGPKDVQSVVLTGGMSRSLLVREKLQQYFQRDISLQLDPELAVVTGNAIYGNHLSRIGSSTATGGA